MCANFVVTEKSNTFADAKNCTLSNINNFNH